MLNRAFICKETERIQEISMLFFYSFYSLLEYGKSVKVIIFREPTSNLITSLRSSCFFTRAKLGELNFQCEIYSQSLRLQVLLVQAPVIICLKFGCYSVSRSQLAFTLSSATLKFTLQNQDIHFFFTWIFLFASAYVLFQLKETRKQTVIFLQ